MADPSRVNDTPMYLLLCRRLLESDLKYCGSTSTKTRESLSLSGPQGELSALQTGLLIVAVLEPAKSCRQERCFGLGMLTMSMMRALVNNGSFFDQTNGTSKPTMAGVMTHVSLIRVVLYVQQ